MMSWVLGEGEAGEVVACVIEVWASGFIVSAMRCRGLRDGALRAHRPDWEKLNSGGKSRRKTGKCEAERRKLVARDLKSEKV